MKLSRTAVFALRGLDFPAKKRIGASLGVTASSVYRWIQDNEVNGQLTKAAAIKAISEETGLAEGEILEEVDSKVTN